jgi:molybdopterin converting factor small subunit
MKKFYILLFAFAATNSFGQTTNSNTPGIAADTKNTSVMDSTLKVVYAEKKDTIQTPAYFLNYKFVNQTFFGTLNPKLIESLTVVKANVQIDKVQYYGQIHIKTKDNYNPKIISLTDLKEKYTNLKDKPVLFMIDGIIINADYDNFVVDENNLLKIIVDKLQNAKESIDLGLIKLLTKSDENLKKANEIILRGTEVTMSK